MKRAAVMSLSLMGCATHRLPECGDHSAWLELEEQQPRRYARFQHLNFEGCGRDSFMDEREDWLDNQAELQRDIERSRYISAREVVSVGTAAPVVVCRLEDWESEWACERIDDDGERFNALIRDMSHVTTHPSATWGELQDSARPIDLQGDLVQWTVSHADGEHSLYLLRP